MQPNKSMLELREWAKIWPSTSLDEFHHSKPSQDQEDLSNPFVFAKWSITVLVPFFFVWYLGAHSNKRYPLLQELSIGGMHFLRKFITSWDCICRGNHQSGHLKTSHLPSENSRHQLKSNWAQMPHRNAVSTHRNNWCLHFRKQCSSSLCAEPEGEERTSKARINRTTDQSGSLKILHSFLKKNVLSFQPSQQQKRDDQRK